MVAGLTEHYRVGGVILRCAAAIPPALSIRTWASLRAQRGLRISDHKLRRSVSIPVLLSFSLLPSV